MSKLLSKAFWISAAETALVTGFAAFAASGVFTSGVPTVKGLIAASVAAGVAALYSFVKQVGGVQTTNAASAAAKK